MRLCWAAKFFQRQDMGEICLEMEGKIRFAETRIGYVWRGGKKRKIYRRKGDKQTLRELEFCGIFQFHKHLCLSKIFKFEKTIMFGTFS